MRCAFYALMLSCACGVSKKACSWEIGLFSEFKMVVQLQHTFRNGILVVGCCFGLVPGAGSVQESSKSRCV